MSEPLFPESAVMSVLRRFNPWWQGRLPNVPDQHRSLFDPLWEDYWRRASAAPLLLRGPRGAGKTTLLLQLAAQLARAGASAPYVLYAPFDHPVIRQAGLEGVVAAWSHATPRQDGPIFLLFDEVTFAEGWAAWLARHHETSGGYRILAAASTVPPDGSCQAADARDYELPTLSFAEYVRFRGEGAPGVPEAQPLRGVFAWSDDDFERMAAAAHPLVSLFNDYVLRGGFPMTAREGCDLETAQALLRERVLAPALRADAALLLGVRRVDELEQLFLYVCLHGGEPFDLAGAAARLEVSKTTVRNHLELLEAAHLVTRTQEFGYGTEVQRGKMKVSLTDPALGFAMLLRGGDALEDSTLMQAAVEACVYRHTRTRDTRGGPAFSYWRNRQGERVSFVATGAGGTSRPFDVAYHDEPAGDANLKGLRRFCAEREVPMAYVLTKRLDDFGPLTLHAPGRGDQPALETRCMRVPAALFCYWAG